MVSQKRKWHWVWVPLETPKLKQILVLLKTLPDHFSSEKGPPLCGHIEHIRTSQASIVKDYGGEEVKEVRTPALPAPSGPALSSSLSPSPLPAFPNPSSSI